MRVSRFAPPTTSHPDPAKITSSVIKVSRSHNRRQCEIRQSGRWIRKSTPITGHGHPATARLGYSIRTNRQHHQPSRELLLQILPVPCNVLASTVVRGRGRLTSSTNALRSPAHRGIRARQDGGGTNRRHSARSHHESERHADSSKVRPSRETDETEP